MTDDSAEVLFQSFQAIVNSSGMGRDVHSLMLYIQLFLRGPRRRPFCKVFWREVLGRLSWRVYKLPSLDSCRKRFLRIYEEDYLAAHPVIGSVLQVGVAEKFLTYSER